MDFKRIIGFNGSVTAIIFYEIIAKMQPFLRLLRVIVRNKMGHAHIDRYSGLFFVIVTMRIDCPLVLNHIPSGLCWFGRTP